MQPSESGTRKDLVFHRIETAKEEQKSIQSTMRADIRKNRKESEIDKDTAGVSG